MRALNNRSRFGAFLVLIGIASLVVGLLVPGALAHHSDDHTQGPPDDPGQGQGSPPGNNGTIKIDGFEFKDFIPGEPHDPNNEPHVACVFNLEYSGFDEGADLLGTYSFELQPPTTVDGNNVLETGSVAIGEDVAGGATDIDAIVGIDLGPELTASGAVPHPQQGFHVKVTVHADGSIGADTKYKVLWTEPCVPPPSTPTPTPPTTPAIDIEVLKTNDANGDGTFTDSEPASGPGLAVPFRAVITNTGDSPVTITSLSDAYLGTILNVCPELIGTTLQPGQSVTCNFTVTNYSPPAGGSLVNTVTVIGTEPGNPSNTTTDNDDSTVQTPSENAPPPLPPPPPGPPAPPGQPPGPPPAPPGQPPGPPTETPPVVLPTVIESTPPESIPPHVLPTRINRPDNNPPEEEQPSVLPKVKRKRFANLPTTGVDPNGFLALAGLFLASGGSMLAGGSKKRR